jgi:hypothetical protein
MADSRSAVSCYRDLVLQSFGDTAPPTYMFWCGTLSTGATLYRTSPEGIFSLGPIEYLPDLNF